MLNKFFSKNLKYRTMFSKSNLNYSFYSFEIKNFAKKDKGRLSDSDSKRGAKAFASTDTFEFSTGSGNKEIQTVQNHKV